MRVGFGWNRGQPPPSLLGVLTDRVAVVDHRFEPACRGVRGEALLVAFAAQGPGLQQWVAPCSAARAAGVQLDTLYLADPSNSYYQQDPTGGWGGHSHFEAIVREHGQHYGKVLMISSSMGATAALQHAALADRVLAFGPRAALHSTHGSFVPEHAQRACADAIRRALEAARRSVAVHVGTGNLLDMQQAGLVRGMPGVEVAEHDTFHHNVPMHLEREGLFKRELLTLLQPRAARQWSVLDSK